MDGDVEVNFAASSSEHLLVGYSADVEIVLNHHDKVLRVPTAALVEGGKAIGREWQRYR